MFGVTVFSAGIPMFLFGEEVGAQQPLLYHEVLAHKIDLRGERQQAGRGMFSFYRDAIALRRANPALRSRQIDVIHVHNANRVIAFRRWSEEQELLVVASLNNHSFLQGYELPNDRLGGGAWREVFNSDASVFGGNGVGNAGAPVHPGDGHLAVVIPANAVVVFARE